MSIANNSAKLVKILLNYYREKDTLLSNSSFYDNWEKALLYSIETNTYNPSDAQIEEVTQVYTFEHCFFDLNIEVLIRFNITFIKQMLKKTPYSNISTNQFLEKNIIYYDKVNLEKLITPLSYNKDPLIIARFPIFSLDSGLLIDGNHRLKYILTNKVDTVNFIAIQIIENKAFLALFDYLWYSFNIEKAEFSYQYEVNRIPIEKLIKSSLSRSYLF